MSPAGLQTVEETDRRDGVPEPDEARTSRRTRRALGAVERYKALCAARGQAPTEEDSWLVLLAAVTAENAAQD